jgi:hypothetical protein
MNNTEMAAELRKLPGIPTAVPLPKLKHDAANRLERLDEAVRMAVRMCNELKNTKLTSVLGVKNTYELASFLDRLLE